MHSMKVYFKKCIHISYCFLVLLTAERHGPAGQGYCQGGFSADFTKVREMFVECLLVLCSNMLSFSLFWLI